MGSLTGLGQPLLENPDLSTVCLEPVPTSSLKPFLTITLSPKAGLLRWDEEEEEAQEDRDRGVRAVAFPSRETNVATGGGSGVPGRGAVTQGSLSLAPLFWAEFRPTATLLLTAYGRAIHGGFSVQPRRCRGPAQPGADVLV